VLVIVRHIGAGRILRDAGIRDFGDGRLLV
jgi:hypothetical protein